MSGFNDGIKAAADLLDNDYHKPTLARIVRGLKRPEPSAKSWCGNDIWEILFSILEGDVPDEMTVEVCDKLAAAIKAMEGAQ